MIIKLSNGKEVILDDIIEDPKAEAIKTPPTAITHSIKTPTATFSVVVVFLTLISS